MEPQIKKRRIGPLIADQFKGINKRSCPGQPPYERYGKAYNMPYTELNEKQRAAARDVLQIFDQDAWELAMPRRVYEYPDSTVLVFQPKTWSQLTFQQRKMAAEHLHMDEAFWNGQLATFHDDLWDIPGVTLTDEEFKPFLV